MIDAAERKKMEKALTQSVRKWKLIAEGTAVSQGADNCPLCDLYLRVSPSCAGCPVVLKTDVQYCGVTPYSDFDLYSSQIFDGNDDCHGSMAITTKAKKAARKMYKFLKKLLNELTLTGDITPG